MRSVIAAPRSAAPVIQSHRLMANADLVRRNCQSTQSYIIKDDRLDALAMAVAYWAKAPSVEARTKGDAARTKGPELKVTARTKGDGQN